MHCHDFRNMTNDRYEKLSQVELSYYKRGYSIPGTAKRTFMAYTDGGCFNNGEADATAYGSYKIFDVSEMVYYPSEDANSGILPSNIHQICQDPRFGECDSSLRFSIPVEPGRRATNNYAEARSIYKTIDALERNNYLNSDNFILVISDSQLVVNYLIGKSKIRNMQLSGVYKNIKKILHSALRVEQIYSHVLLKNIPGTLMKKIVGH